MTTGQGKILIAPGAPPAKWPIKSEAGGVQTKGRRGRHKVGNSNARQTMQASGEVTSAYDGVPRRTVAKRERRRPCTSTRQRRIEQGHTRARSAHQRRLSSTVVRLGRFSLNRERRPAIRPARATRRRVCRYPQPFRAGQGVEFRASLTPSWNTRILSKSEPSNRMKISRAKLVRFAVPNTNQ